MSYLYATIRRKCTDGEMYSLPTLINLSSILTLRSRPLNGDPKNHNWEVVVFYSEDRRFNPNPQKGEPIEPQWVGSYDTVFEGSQDRCTRFLEGIANSLGNDLVNANHF